MSRITPCLWFDGQAEEAANYYVSLFPNSGIGSVSRYGEGSPFPAGTAMMVEFVLDGQTFQALNGGPQFRFTEAVSLSIDCADQAEVDYYWDHLTEGGEESMCGWLKDRFGVSWQIIPTRMLALLKSPDVAGRDRAFAAMLEMKKLDIAAIEAAFRGA